MSSGGWGWGVCGIYSPDPFSRTLGWKSSFKVNPPGGSTSKTVSDPNIKRLLRPCVTVRDTAMAPAFHELPTEPETPAAAQLLLRLLQPPSCTAHAGTPREELLSHLKEGTGSGGPARV